MSNATLPKNWLEEAFAPNARGKTLADFTMPAVGSSVAVSVDLTDWMVLGQALFVQTAGTMTVTSIEGSKACHLKNTGDTGNASPSAVIASGSPLTSSGKPGPPGDAGVVTESLDSSGGVVAGNLVGPSPSASGQTRKLTGRGYSAGIATEAASASAEVATRSAGLVEVAVTGLAPSNPGPVIRDPATGNLVRVAEPQPDDDYQGEADAFGNLIPRPARIVKPAITINAKDFGAKGDGATNNVTAFRACFAKAAAIGAMLGCTTGPAVAVALDGGNYYLDDTVVMAANDADHAYTCGIVLSGAIRSRTSGAALPTQITWTAAAPNGTTGTIVGSTGVVTGITGATPQSVGQYLAVMVGANIGHYPIKTYVSATSVTIDTNGGLLADQAGSVHWMIVKPVISILSRDCTVENVNFFATSSAAALCGVQYTKSAGTSPRPCTRNGAERVRVSSEGGTGIFCWGFTIGDAVGSAAFPLNCDFHRFVDCIVDRTHFGGWGIPNTSGQSKRHTFFDCQVLGWGDRVQWGIRLRTGSFTSYSMSFNTIAYGVGVTSATDTIEIYSPDVENCGTFLRAEGGQAAGFPVLLCGGRYDVTNMGAVQTATVGSSDGIYLKWNWSPLTLVNVLFGGPCDVTFKIQLNGASTGVSSRFSMLGGVLPGTSLPWVEDVANHYPQTYFCKGVVGTDGGGSVTDIANGTTEFGAVVEPTETIPKIAGLVGLSTGADRMKNFAGSVTIGGATTSAIVTLPIAEAYDYDVQITAESLYGTPAAGSLEVFATPLSGNTDKKEGFNLNLKAGPGTDAATRYFWQIIGGRWSPQKIVGLRHLWMAHQKVTFSAGVIISHWRDVIANEDLAPVVAAPTIATWRNGMPAAKFVASLSQYLQTGALGPYTQPHTIAMVLQDSDLAATRIAFDGRTLEHIIAHQTTDNVVLNAGGGIVYGSAADLSTPTALIAVFNGTSSGIYVNGTHTSNASDVGSNALDGITLGAFIGPSNFWDGYIPIVADIDGTISAADAASFTSWARDLYAF